MLHVWVELYHGGGVAGFGAPVNSNIDLNRWHSTMTVNKPNFLRRR